MRNTKDARELSALIDELTEQDRQLTRLIGEAINRGELPVALRERRRHVRQALDDAIAAEAVLLRGGHTEGPGPAEVLQRELEQALAALPSR